MTVLDLNDRAIMDGFFSMNGMDKKSDEIMLALENRADMTDSEMKELLVSRVKMLPCKAETLLDFLAITGEREELLQSLSLYRGIDGSFDRALDRLITEGGTA